jgi:dienelactone hydrolase
MRILLAGAVLLASTLCAAFSVSAAESSSASVAASSEGNVAFQPAEQEEKLPARFRLPAHTFAYKQTQIDDPSRALTLLEVTFPSPVVTPHPNNNTVHCEYFQPTTPGKHPGVIVLHILGGDFALSRLFCRTLAHHGVAALFLKMPYYGPRRQPEVKARMVSVDPHETVRGMTQAVLDVRQATAWLGSRPEVDDQQLGIMGISLGGITAALAASAEPRLKNICLILAGGDIGEVAWNAPHLVKLRERWLADGGTKEQLIALLREVDPATYARAVTGRRILMLNAAQDEVIPPACTESLWRGLGQPEIVWWEAGHYSAVQYIFEGLARAVKFFAEEPAGRGVMRQATPQAVK